MRATNSSCRKLWEIKRAAGVGACEQRAKIIHGLAQSFLERHLGRPTEDSASLLRIKVSLADFAEFGRAVHLGYFDTQNRFQHVKDLVYRGALAPSDVKDV